MLSKGGTVSQPAPVTTSQPANVEKKQFTPFKVGSKGESVKKIQELLGVKADGSFGPGTDKAVKSFQKKSSLPVTGVVDQATLKALRGK